MATAVRWLNSSGNWATSSAYYYDKTNGQNSDGVKDRTYIQVIAYDNFTVNIIVHNNAVAVSGAGLTATWTYGKITLRKTNSSGTQLQQVTWDAQSGGVGNLNRAITNDGTAFYVVWESTACGSQYGTGAIVYGASNNGSKTFSFASPFYTVSYDANGGSGAPSAQNAIIGSNTVSSTIPSRTGYSFLGWSESSTATTATYAAGGTINISGNVTLYAVWKAELSDVSASNGTIGTSQNIIITQQGTVFNYNHALKYSVTGNNGTASGTIVSGKTGSSATITQAWTPPSSIVSKVTNSKTCTCVITCETYSGSTLLGSKTTSITLTIPSSYAPTFTASSISRTADTYPTGFSDWVSGKTTPVFSGTVSVKNSATVASWKFTVNGSTTTVSDSDTSKTWTGAAVTSGNLTMTVTDSRGYTASYSVSPTIVAYASPAITNLVMARADSGGTITSQGEYLKVEANIDITSLSNTNTKTWRVQYREQGDTTWTIDDSGTLASYSSVFSWVSASDIIDESKTYETRIVVTDYYGNVIASSTVSTAQSIIDIKANGLGVAFGKVHTEADDSVVVAYPWSLIRPVQGIGNEIINGFLTLTNGSTSGGASTLPSFGTWLILCMNVNVPERTGLFLYNTGTTLGSAIKIAGASDITITASGKDISVKTGTGTCYTFAIKLSSKT